MTERSSPTVAKEENKVVTLKPDETWSTKGYLLANNNFKALNAIFVVVDVTQFKLISNSESIRNA